MAKLSKVIKNRPTPGQIFQLDQPRLRRSTHPHYCVVLQVDATHALVNYMSSKFDLFHDERDIAIYPADPEFSASGLRFATYLICEVHGLVKVPIENLYTLGGSVGVATGRFLERIEDWWGEKL